MEYVIVGALLALAGYLLGYAAGYKRGALDAEYVRKVVKILRAPPGSEISSIGYRKKQ